MTRCSCCERRIGHSLGEFDCANEYCRRCLLCELHCVFTSDQPVTVAADYRGKPDAD